MGITDQAIFDQLKKGQGETSQRLDALLLAQQRTNQLLEWLGSLLAPKPA